VIVLDTSVLIRSLSGHRDQALALRGTLERGERILIPTLVLYEWLRGPRTDAELVAQEALFPSEGALPYGPKEAALSANLYRSLSRPRGREIDICIAAFALIRDAALWTANPRDFADIPTLRLWKP